MTTEQNARITAINYMLADLAETLAAQVGILAAGGAPKFEQYVAEVRALNAEKSAIETAAAQAFLQ